LLSVWRKPEELASNVNGGDGSIIKEIADNLHLLCYQSDYYWLHTVLYKAEDLLPDIAKGFYWLKDIRVAFEHQPDCRSGLYEQISHLLVMNCDLKVLVTYPNDDGPQQLESLHKVIKENRQSKALSDEEGLLVIFGSEADFRWDGYVYKEDHWKQIN